jgi:hypothetical protein
LNYVDPSGMRSCGYWDIVCKIGDLSDQEEACWAASNCFYHKWFGCPCGLDSQVGSMVVMGYCSDCGGLRHNLGSAGTSTGNSESRESSRNNEGWIRDEGRTTNEANRDPGLGTSETDFTNNRAVVIGEKMVRVRSFANKYGYEYFETESPPSQLMSDNRAWIRARMDEGYTIYDLGPASSNAPPIGDYPYITSDFYAMEQAELAGRSYTRWIPMWEVVDG